MSSFINKVKETFNAGPAPTTHTPPRNDEQSFTIQPHPAKSNDPRDIEPPQLGAGLNSNPEIGALHARGPYVPSNELLSKAPVATREELAARSAELNK